jgi:acyl-CoA dehydrogenase
MRSLLLDSVSALLDQVDGLSVDEAWPHVAAAGLPALLLPEDKSGFGASWSDFVAVMRLIGSHACPLPIGETAIAAKLLDDAGAATPNGPLSLPDNAIHLGALMRVAQSAGAMEAALTMAIDHTSQRQQFGKPLSKLQAVQQSLAIIGTEAAAVDAASQGAARALDAGDAMFEIGCAKLRCNIAIGRVTALAHQVHGAIGFTEDYGLHRFTKSLMGWRSEFGNDRYWAEAIGAQAASLGGAGLWTEMTARSDRAAQSD